jgi:catalase
MSAMPSLPHLLIKALEAGEHHSGERLNHACGMVASGSFSATPQAAELTVAAHMQGQACPIRVRFSNFSGDAQMPDNDARANPRGAAIRFALPDGSVMDLIGHSANGFPARTPEEMLAFVHAVNLSSKQPEILQDLLKHNSAAKRFIELPLRTPASYLGQPYYFLHAYVLIGPHGRRTVGRLRLEPIHKPVYPGDDQLREMPKDFLRRELASRITQGTAHIDLVLQLAEPGDVTNDITSIWPEHRAIVKLGRLTLQELDSDVDHEAALAFNPRLLVPGIENTGDPMLAARCRAYSIAVQHRWNAR